jgi:hypothetical protein
VFPCCYMRFVSTDRLSFYPYVIVRVLCAACNEVGLHLDGNIVVGMRLADGLRLLAPTDRGEARCERRHAALMLHPDTSAKVKTEIDTVRTLRR